MIRNIFIPPYLRRGITHNWIGYPHRLTLFGADFETYEGKPYSLQIYDGKDVYFRYVNEKNVLDVFLKYFDKRLLAGQLNVCYFHNLSFDLGVLFYKFHSLYIGRDIIKVKNNDWKISACISKVCFARLRRGKTLLNLYDTLAFLQGGSLDNWCKKLDLPVKKLKKPDGLGTVRLKSKSFINYAKNDAVAEYHLGKYVLSQYEKYNTRICVSSASFSARIFRHKFMIKGETIDYPDDKRLIEGAILSYHGGRNGYYYPNPAVFENCCEVDISSAYPYALSCLPNFAHGEYRHVEGFSGEGEGIYEISGVYTGCKYPSVFNHDFSVIKNNSFVDRLWITSYELKEAITDRSFKNLKIQQGFIFFEDVKAEHNPFKNFVDSFYKLKEENRNDVLNYYIYKIILNSLYGKFIQTNGFGDEVILDIDNAGNITINNSDSVEGKRYYVAGGLFNPFIATLITGFTRAYLHRLEHKFRAIHSSTDSVKFNFKNYTGDVKGLGGYKLEVIGKCIILRNKLYIHYNEKGVIEKYALHGFSGYTDKEKGITPVSMLLKMIDEKTNEYKTRRILKVKEGIRQGKTPLKMLDFEKTLNVDLSTIEQVSSY